MRYVTCQCQTENAFSYCFQVPSVEDALYMTAQKTMQTNQITNFSRSRRKSIGQSYAALKSSRPIRITC